MPNDCFVSLHVQGHERDVNRFRVENEVVNRELSDLPRLSFECTLPTPDFEESGSELSPKWLKWRLENWGTKWDIMGSNDAGVGTIEANGCLHYFFYTAWAPPNAWFKTVVERHPFLDFALFYNEPGFRLRGGLYGVCGELYQSRYISRKWCEKNARGHNSSTPEEVLKELVRGTWSERIAVAGNSALSAPLVEKLLVDRDPRIRGKLALVPTLSLEQALSLLLDRDEWVVKFATSALQETSPLLYQKAKEMIETYVSNNNLHLLNLAKLPGKTKSNLRKKLLGRLKTISANCSTEICAN